MALIFLLTIAVLLKESQGFSMSPSENRFLRQSNDTRVSEDLCQAEVNKFVSSGNFENEKEVRLLFAEQYLGNLIHMTRSPDDKPESVKGNSTSEVKFFRLFIYFLSREDLTFSCYILGQVDPSYDVGLTMKVFKRIIPFPQEVIWNMFAFLAKNDSISLYKNVERKILELVEEYDIITLATRSNETAYVFKWLYDKGVIDTKQIKKLDIDQLSQIGVLDSLKSSDIAIMTAIEKSAMSEAEILEFLRNFTEASGGNTSNKAALEYAVERGQVDVVKYLLAKGTKVNILNESDAKLLRSVIVNEKNDILRLLVQDNIDVDARNSKGETLLYLAAKYQNYEAVRILKSRGADVNSADEDGDTLLHLAAKRGDAKAVEGLVEIGADVNPSNEGMTPLYRAAQYGHMQAMMTLLAHQADLKFGPKSGNKLLHLAAMNNDSLVVESILDFGIDPNMRGLDGFAAMHWAARTGFCGVVQLLLKNGADIEARNNLGRTPLHEAAYWAQIECCSLLVASGADVLAVDKSGKRPSQLAKQNVHLFLYKALKNFENKRKLTDDQSSE